MNPHNRQIQEYLNRIYGGKEILLKCFHISPAVAIPIMGELETEEQQLEMGIFLRPLLGTEVPEETILQKAIEITGSDALQYFDSVWKK